MNDTRLPSRLLPLRATLGLLATRGLIAALAAAGATHPMCLLAQEAAQKPLHADLASSSAAVAATAAAPSSSEFSIVGAIATDPIIRLSLGHLVFLNAKNRIRRIYIANPAVVDSYTVSPHQLVITAKAPGISSVVVWDENDVPQTYTVSADCDIDMLRSSIARALPNEKIQAEASQGRVILTGTVGSTVASDAAVKLATNFVKDVVNSLVINPAQTKQVKLKVRIVEVDRSRLNQFGINIFNPTGSTIAGSTTSQFPVTTTLTSGTSGSSSGTGGVVGGNTLTVSDPLNFLLYSAKANLGVTIKDLENKQILQILAEPTITTMSGQKANFLAGGEFPFPVVQGSSGGLTSITVQFRPYGVKLEFTPDVNVDGTIALKVAPEVSALDYTNAVTISGYTIPALSTRHAETQVVLRSGQSFAISGLLDRRTTDILGKTPGISNIPILGALFKSKGVTLSTSELIVIVTPTIVDPLTDMTTPDEPAPARPYLNPQTFKKDMPAPPAAQPPIQP
jgi:pilus assembly protein CpaC